MPIASIVVRTKDDCLEEVVDQVKQYEGVSISDIGRDKFIVVSETETREQDKNLWERLEAVPGVLKVDLIYYNFEDLEEETHG